MSSTTTFRVTGDLTIRDVTKVNRKDWGLTWNAALDAGGVLVSEKVTLEFDLSAIKQDG